MNLVAQRLIYTLFSKAGGIDASLVHNVMRVHPLFIPFVMSEIERRVQFVSSDGFIRNEDLFITLLNLENVVTFLFSHGLITDQELQQHFIRCVECYHSRPHDILEYLLHFDSSLTENIIYNIFNGKIITVPTKHQALCAAYLLYLDCIFHINEFSESKFNKELTKKIKILLTACKEVGIEIDLSDIEVSYNLNCLLSQSDETTQEFIFQSLIELLNSENIEEEVSLVLVDIEPQHIRQLVSLLIKNEETRPSDKKFNFAFWKKVRNLYSSCNNAGDEIGFHLNSYLNQCGEIMQERILLLMGKLLERSDLQEVLGLAFTKFEKNRLQQFVWLILRDDILDSYDTSWYVMLAKTKVVFDVCADSGMQVGYPDLGISESLKKYIDQCDEKTKVSVSISLAKTLGLANSITFLQRELSLKPQNLQLLVRAILHVLGDATYDYRIKLLSIFYLDIMKFCGENCTKKDVIYKKSHPFYGINRELLFSILSHKLY